MPDFSTFEMDSVIMHQIPKGKAPTDDSQPIEYSEAEIELRPTDRSFIQARIRSTLGGYARPVIEDGGIESPVPDIVRGLINGSADLVSGSAEVARVLYGHQAAVSPGGLVMTITGALDGDNCIVIAKMEHQEGMRVESTTTSGGLRTYRAQYLHDLILSQGTRVYKAGVFSSRDAQPGRGLAGAVVDDQQRQGAVAEYFVEFLGCQFMQRADVLTEKFFKTTQKFIASRTKADPERGAEYEIALLSEMQSKAGRLQPSNFAMTHLSLEDRDAYVGALDGAGVPVQGFTKDVTLVRSSIRRVRIHTEGGADVFAPPEMYHDGAVAVESLEATDASRIVVQDKIIKVSGASGQRPPAA